MGRIYIRTFADCAKHGMILEITCPRCMRVVYRRPDDIVGIKTPGGHQVRSHHDIEEVARAMRCRGEFGRKGCGAKGARLAALRSSELKVPAGVPLLPYLNANERERTRLVRIARG